jgi:transposase
MEKVYTHCVGLDVHKVTVVACRLSLDQAGRKQKDSATFGTTTAELLRLSDWLTAGQCTHVAMESTGEFWKPVWNILEGNFELLLVNAQHIKRVPGRKTDVQDAEWLAELLQHGLVKASFIPPREQRERRDLTRQRTQLVRERAGVVNRLQKVLEDANLKVSAVLSDMTGLSGRAILDALVTETLDPSKLPDLVHGRAREKLPALEQALRGQVRAHHRFLLSHHLAHLDFLDAQIAAYSAEIARVTQPHEDLVTLLDTIPGIARPTAELLLAEIGPDLSRFPSAAHLAAWAGVAPGNNESAGKHRSGKTRKGSQWLRTGLVQAAQTVGRQKKTYLAAHYHQIAARRGKKRAVMALAHTLLVIAYHVITCHEPYRELGANYLDERRRTSVVNRLGRRLAKLGYAVVPLPTPPAITTSA